MQRPFLWSKPSPAVRISQPRGRPVSSEPPTPPPRGQSRGQRRGIIKYKYSEPPSSPSPLMSRPPRLHRYPSVSFDLSPAPSSRGSSLIVDLWWCPRWPQCPLSLVLCPCCPSCSLLAFHMNVEGFPGIILLLENTSLELFSRSRRIFSSTWNNILCNPRHLFYWSWSSFFISVTRCEGASLARVGGSQQSPARGWAISRGRATPTTTSAPPTCLTSPPPRWRVSWLSLRYLSANHSPVFWALSNHRWATVAMRTTPPPWPQWRPICAPRPPGTRGLTSTPGADTSPGSWAATSRPAPVSAPWRAWTQTRTRSSASAPQSHPMVSGHSDWHCNVTNSFLASHFSNFS